ncbi:hypothetical protein Pcinc_034433 [Petrolisthes cinctipes]|uniref:Uncharacterized protein n=1 Tax=Petrolisthes cinctipes TaxID=88211 RepID=A0AAE1EQA4_PETCI|nr:hypothetical protein Pcinc_034433 [Petrolisthes cinctipes]
MSTSYPHQDLYSKNAKNTGMCNPMQHSVRVDFTDDCGTTFEEVFIGGVMLYNATCSKSISIKNDKCCHYFSDDTLPGTDKHLVLYCAPPGQGYWGQKKIIC